MEARTLLPRSLGVFSALILASTLGACSPAGGSAISLADSKATVQLLRLDTSSQIPGDFVSEIVRTSDIAEECGDGDPNLRWVSSASARFTSEHTADVDAVYQELVDGFVTRGWTNEEIAEGASRLSSDDSIAVVEISRHPETTPASVDITSTGPCVATDGLGSDEVERLVKG